MASCFHNTGEGGLSPYHLLGGDVVFEIGTGYFGVRDKDGKFSMDILAEKCAKYPQIRAIEIKLSQGAKPGKGGVLPGGQGGAGDRCHPSRARLSGLHLAQLPRGVQRRGPA